MFLRVCWRSCSLDLVVSQSRPGQGFVAQSHWVPGDPCAPSPEDPGDPVWREKQTWELPRTNLSYVCFSSEHRTAHFRPVRRSAWRRGASYGFAGPHAERHQVRGGIGDARGIGNARGRRGRWGLGDTWGPWGRTRRARDFAPPWSSLRRLSSASAPGPSVALWGPGPAEVRAAGPTMSAGTPRLLAPKSQGDRRPRSGPWARRPRGLSGGRAGLRALSGTAGCRPTSEPRPWPVCAWPRPGCALAAGAANAVVGQLRGLGRDSAVRPAPREHAPSPGSPAQSAGARSLWTGACRAGVRVWPGGGPRRSGATAVLSRAAASSQRPCAAVYTKTNRN